MHRPTLKRWIEITTQFSIETVTFDIKRIRSLSNNINTFTVKWFPFHK